MVAALSMMAAPGGDGVNIAPSMIAAPGGDGSPVEMVPLPCR